MLIGLLELRVHGPRLTLRLPEPSELNQWGLRVAGSLLTSEQRHWMGEWASQPDPEFFANQLLARHFARLGSFRREEWTLPFAAFYRGRMVGLAGMETKDFPRCGEINTMSVLEPAARGQRLGVEARSLLLSLAFQHMNGLEALTTHHPDNLVAQAVSARLGYQRDGLDVRVMGGAPVRQQRWRVIRAKFKPQGECRVEGLPACQELLLREAADKVGL